MEQQIIIEKLEKYRKKHQSKGKTLDLSKSGKTAIREPKNLTPE